MKQEMLIIDIFL